MNFGTRIPVCKIGQNVRAFPKDKIGDSAARFLCAQAKAWSREESKIAHFPLCHCLVNRAKFICVFFVTLIPTVQNNMGDSCKQGLFLSAQFPRANIVYSQYFDILICTLILSHILISFFLSINHQPLTPKTNNLASLLVT